ncbi:MAG: lysylphosphatidylglycerol synthase transmembrane domain-containing protein [Syntrophobacter sp.]
MLVGHSLVRRQVLFGLLVSAGAVYLFLRVVDLGQMAEALARMHPLYLIPCTAIYLVSFAFRVLRWQYLMKPVARVGFRSLLSAFFIGALGNNLLPAHMGELVRAYVVGRKEGVSKSAVLATVVLERVYDGLTVLFMLLVVLLFMDMPERGVEGSVLTAQGLRAAGWLALLLFAGLMAGLQFLRWKRRHMLLFLSFCLRPLPEKFRDRALEMAGSFADGLEVTRAGDLLWVIIYSLLTWGFLGLWAWSLFPAFDLQLGLMAGFLLEVVIALALLIPSAPAFLGTFHMAAAFTLGYLGAPSGKAGSYAIILWMVNFLCTSLLGIYFLWRGGMGLRALSREEAPQAASEELRPNG